MADDRIVIDEAVLLRIGAIADEAAVRVYAVGGHVRDLLLGRPGTDIDVVVIGDGVAFARRVAKALGRPSPVVFDTFGTAMVTTEHGKLEFVGARKESYARDSRKPQVEPGSLDDDLARRDFTVNAMAVALNADTAGTIADPFGGRIDLRRKVLRTPLDPERTFDDDPLRMLRAARFAAQLGFMIDPAVVAAIGAMRERIGIVSKERVADEFLKLMASPSPSSGLAVMHETGLMNILIPEISAMAGVEQRKEYHHKDVFWHTLKVVENIAAETDDVWLRVAALLHDVAKPRTKSFKEGTGWTFHGHEEVGARMVRPMFKKLRLPLAKVSYVEKLVRLHLRPMALVDSEVTDSAVRRLMFDAGEDVDDLMLLCRADITSKNLRKVDRIHRNYDLVISKMKEVDEKDRIRAWQPPIRGEEIMEICGLGPSPVIGALKDAITEAILEGTIRNDHDEAREFLLRVKDAIVEEYEKTGKAPKIPRDILFRGKDLPPA